MEVTLFDEALFSQVIVSRTTAVLNVKSADVHSACGSVRSSLTVPGEWPLLLVTPFKDELEAPYVNPLLCRLAESVQGKDQLQIIAVELTSQRLFDALKLVLFHKGRTNVLQDKLTTL